MENLLYTKYLFDHIDEEWVIPFEEFESVLIENHTKKGAGDGK